MKLTKTLARRGICEVDGHVDFKQNLRPRETRHDEAGGAGVGITEMFTENLLDRLTIGAVADINMQLAGVIETAARFFNRTRAFLMAWSARAAACYGVQPRSYMTLPSTAARVRPRR